MSRIRDRRYESDGERIYTIEREEEGEGAEKRNIRKRREVARVEGCPKCGGRVMFRVERDKGGEAEGEGEGGAKEIYVLQCGEWGECSSPAVIGGSIVEVVSKWNKRAGVIDKGERCDFCGGRMVGKRLENIIGEEEWIVECERCGAFSTDVKGSEGEAMGAWGRRIEKREEDKKEKREGREKRGKGKKAKRGHGEEGMDLFWGAI